MSDINENIEYIESYFKNRLNSAEKQEFEQRCVNDEVFAGQVALYITAEEGIRQNLLQQKKKHWQTNDDGSETAAIVPLNRRRIQQWLPYATAACFVIALVLYFVFRVETPAALADTYVKKNYAFLSHRMNASKDSLELGKAAYNNKDYNTALQIFSKINQLHPEDGEVKKYVGLVYLVTKDYDRALQHFNELAAMKDQYQNPGLFLKAIALLERNRPADKTEAKQVLEQIVKENKEGKREAEYWLEKW